MLDSRLCLTHIMKSVNREIFVAVFFFIFAIFNERHATYKIKLLWIFSNNIVIQIKEQFEIKTAKFDWSQKPWKRKYENFPVYSCQLN